MDRFKLAACGLAGVIALSGCSAGQQAQSAVQEPAVNGTSLNVGPVALRNIHLRADQESDYVQPGREVELLFQAANNSPDVNDKLRSITSDIGTVTLTGDTTLPAGGVLTVGAPDGQPTPLEDVDAAEAAEAKLTLTKPITNGLNYNFTFDFEKAGSTTVAVPISAGESARRDPVQDTGAAPGDEPSSLSGGH